MDRAPVDATGTRRIAVCLDDFGLHAGINAAALALASAGRVSAIGCMVGAPHWREGVAALRSMDPARVDIGLHLDLTEHPLTPGVRRSLPQWLLRTHLGLADRALLRREIAAQLDAFHEAVGRPPAYVDGHQHVHQLPGVRQPLLEALRERAWMPQPWLRSTRRPAGSGLGKPWVIETLGEAALRREARREGLRQNGHLLGVYDFGGDAARYLALLREWLAAARDGDVLMCHPAVDAPADDGIGAARRHEYQVLAGAEFAQLLADSGLRIAPISEALAARPALA